MVHGLPSSGLIATPALQTPEPSHEPAWWHASSGAQAAPAESGAWVTPETKSQASAVHGLPSSIAKALPDKHLPLASHVSLPLQTLPSEHDVPDAAGVCLTPAVGSHESTVHGLPSSTTSGVPGAQLALASHFSAPLQTFESEQLVPTATGVWTTPPVAVHESAVHGLPSSTTKGVPALQAPAPSQSSSPLQRLESAQEVPCGVGVWLTPEVGSQASVVHGLPSSTTRGLPEAQTPEPSQVSLPLHALPSEQDAPWATEVCFTPADGSQESAVQGFPSSTTGEVPAVQTPDPSQVSLPLQAFPSEQEEPSATGAWWTPVVGSHESAVHKFPSSTTKGAPAPQKPMALHVSWPLQTFASSQLVPSAAGVCVTPAVALQASTVQGLPSSMTGATPAAHAPVLLQVSAPLQAFRSEHEVPGVTGVWRTPSFASQESAVHGLPSSTTGAVPAEHAPCEHVSEPLQALPSEQEVPSSAAAWVTPVAGSQASAVQGLPSSSVGGVPGLQTPAPLHVSLPLQAFPSEQDVPGGTTRCVTPRIGSHESTVQGLPSSVTGAVPAPQLPELLHVSAPLHALPSEQLVPAVAGVWSTPKVGSQLSAVHGFPSSSDGGAPGLQTPEALQVSVPLQALLSAQEVPTVTGVCVTPWVGSQLSAVHGLPSSSAGAVPALQVPVELQVSLPLQALPSEHEVPVATGWCLTPAVASQLSVVHGLPSSVTGAVPGEQVPTPLQVSAPLQTFASAQDVPAGSGVNTGCPAALQESCVHGLLSFAVHVGTLWKSLTTPAPALTSTSRATRVPTTWIPPETLIVPFAAKNLPRIVPEPKTTAGSALSDEEPFALETNTSTLSGPMVAPVAGPKKLPDDSTKRPRRRTSQAARHSRREPEPNAIELNAYTPPVRRSVVPDLRLRLR
jgi:hypothetical protein